MDVKSRLTRFLVASKKSTILLSELENQLLDVPCSYEQFAEAVLQLEADGALEMMKSKGRTSKQPSLAFHYRLQKGYFQTKLHNDIHRAALTAHASIRLEAYYSLESEVWQEDWPYIQLIDRYLKQHGLPNDEVPAPERSFELVGDEKWMTDKRGKELLERIRLWDKLLVIPVADPLMLAVNPYTWSNGQTVHRHLIVENKTTYQALLKAFPAVPFTTLIFGGGDRILKSIELLPLQLPLPKDPHFRHLYYYFGDIDKKGIAIWHSLYKRTLQLFGCPLIPALPFYQACLAKNYSYGKETQREQAEAFEEFLLYFPMEQQERIRTCFAEGGYYPQEILRTSELCDIWRNTEWTI